MKTNILRESESGFSLVELMLSAAILLPLLGAVVLLFARGVDYYGAEQRTAQMNQEARMAMEVMSLEIAQAGARKDIATTLTAAVTGSAAATTVNVNSSSGFAVGDIITVDPAGATENVVLTAAGTNTLTGRFNKSHLNGATVTLYALPYLTGIVPPAGIAPNASVAVTSFSFYGDFYENGDLYYIEYKYIAGVPPALGQITKSITKLDSGAESPSQVLIENVTGPASPFTLYTDANGAVTSVSVSLAVQSTWKNGQYNYSSNAPEARTTQLNSRMVAPSVAAASTLTNFNKTFGPVYDLPTTPAKVTTWSAN